MTVPRNPVGVTALDPGRENTLRVRRALLAESRSLCDRASRD